MTRDEENGSREMGAETAHSVLMSPSPAAAHPNLFSGLLESILAAYDDDDNSFELIHDPRSSDSSYSSKEIPTAQAVVVPDHCHPYTADGLSSPVAPGRTVRFAGLNNNDTNIPTSPLVKDGGFIKGSPNDRYLQVLRDLGRERSNRKRKERNIVLLAKELHTRTLQVQAQQREMEKLNAAIQALKQNIQIPADNLLLENESWSVETNREEIKQIPEQQLHVTNENEPSSRRRSRIEILKERLRQTEVRVKSLASPCHGNEESSSLPGHEPWSTPVPADLDAHGEKTFGQDSSPERSGEGMSTAYQEVYSKLEFSQREVKRLEKELFNKSDEIILLEKSTGGHEMLETIHQEIAAKDEQLRSLTKELESQKAAVDILFRKAAEMEQEMKCKLESSRIHTEQLQEELSIKTKALLEMEQAAAAANNGVISSIHQQTTFPEGIEGQEQLITEIDAQKCLVDDLRIQIARLEKELESGATASSTELSRLKEEVLCKQNVIIELEQSIALGKNNLDEMRKEISDKEEHLRSITSEYELQISKVKELREEVSRLEDALKKTLEDSHAEVNLLQQKLYAKEEELVRLEHAFSFGKNMAESFQNELGINNEHMELLVTELRLQRHVVEDLRREIQERVTFQEETTARQDVIIQQLHDQLRASEHECTKLTEEGDFLKLEVQRLEERVQQDQQELAIALKDSAKVAGLCENLRETIAAKESTIVSLRNEVGSLQGTIEHLQGNLDTQEKALIDLHAELLREQESLATARSQSEAHWDELKLLVEDQKRSNACVTKLQNQAETYLSFIEKLESDLATTQKSLEDLRQTKEGVNPQIEEELSGAKQTVVRLQRDLQERVQRILELEDTLIRLIHNYEEKLEEASKSKAAILKRKDNKIAELEKRIVELEQQLVRKEADEKVKRSDLHCRNSIRKKEASQMNIIHSFFSDGNKNAKNNLTLEEQANRCEEEEPKETILPIQPRRKGILAFLPDKLIHFPIDATAWKESTNKELKLRTGKPRGKKGAHDNIEAGESLLQKKDVGDILSQASAAALLLIDPSQASSLSLLQLLAHRLVKQETLSVQGIIVFMSNPPSHLETVYEFLQNSGMSACFLWECSMFFTKALGWTSCPALAVVETTAGRKVSVTAEEVALEWNPAPQKEGVIDPVIEAWKEGRSALDWKQQAATAILVPSVMCTTM